MPKFTIRAGRCVLTFGPTLTVENIKQSLRITIISRVMERTAVRTLAVRRNAGWRTAIR